MKFRTLACALATGALLGAAAPVTAAAADSQQVDYTLTPALADGELVGLDVEIRFAGDSDGETRLALPDRWASESDYWKGLRDLRIEGAAAREDGPAIRVLTHAPGAPLVVRYRVVSGYDGDPRVGGQPGNPYRPIVRPRWFSAVGQGVFAIPEAGENRPASFRWGNAPSGWRLASDLDHGSRGAQVLSGEIQQSIVMGGPDLRVETRQVAGAEVRVAVLGQWKFTPAAFADTAARVIASQRAYWRDPGEPFLVALTPLTPVEGRVSTGGTGLGDAFSIWTGTDAEVNDLIRLLAHEHMHTWNGRRLGRMPDQEQAGYWFSEGFTDFLTHRVLLQSGLWTLEQFTEQFNRDLAEYAASPARGAANTDIVTGFWTSPAVQRMPYLRGQLLGWLWDYRLRRTTGGRASLDRVLRAQKADAMAAPDGVDQPTITERFAGLYQRAGGGGLVADMDRFVERGDMILLPESLFAPCARVETVRRPNFARGWDGEATTRNGNVLTGLQDGSPAWRAGLRNGMQIVKREFGEPGDSSVEYGLRIRAPDGTETVYRFMPTAPGYQTFQRLVLTPDLDARERAACVRLMGGT